MPRHIPSLQILCLLAALLLCPRANGQDRPATHTRQTNVESWIDRSYGDLFSLYRHFHANPELSYQEEKTAAKLAEQFEAAGFEVTRNVGGHGVVGVLRNGDGPTLLLRTDLDALPVKEETGLPYASEAKAVDDQQSEVPVMHACGHDVHMTCLAGAARLLSEMKDAWRGTLIVIGQPAEERGGGARAMLADGLFERFPTPDFCVAQHVFPGQPAGQIAFTEGHALANVDSMDITVRGVGGHGAFPHGAKDPVVLAAQLVLALQTVVSREIEPIQPAVVTVGSIHGGTKHNIIPSEVRLQLTIRSYTDEVRNQIIESIKRIAEGLARAAGLPDDRMPVVTLGDEFTPALYNDPELTRRLSDRFKGWFGEERVVKRDPRMGGEDFARYGRTEHKIPICMFSLGATKASFWQDAQDGKTSLPSLHSPFFAPDPEPTIKAGVKALAAAALELLGRQE